MRDRKIKGDLNMRDRKINKMNKRKVRKAVVPVGRSGRPRVYSLDVAGGSAYAANKCDFVVDVGYRVSFCQITNYGENSVSVRLNNNNSAIFSLAGGDQKTFTSLVLSNVAFSNTDSGSEGTSVEVIVGF